MLGTNTPGRYLKGNMTILAALIFGATVFFVLDAIWRRRITLGTPRAVTLSLLAVALLAGAAWTLLPVLWDTTAERLRAELAERDTRLSAITTEKATLTRDLADTRTKLLSEAEREARDLAALNADAARVREKLTSGANALVADPIPTGSSTPRDQLRTAIANFGTLRAAPTPQVAARPVPAPAPAPSPLDELKGQMAARMSTPSYDIEAYPDRELIRGRTGRYYVVDLKNATNGVRFFFDGGKYTLARSTPEFRSALNTFIGDILQKFEGKLDYGLFVRGNADQKPYEGAFETDAEFKRIRYLRALGGDKYGVDTSERILGNRVRNADLPELRAAFMQKVVADVYPTKAPTILEGAITSKIDTRDRNVELILYVDW